MFYSIRDHVDWLLGGLVVDFSLSRHLGGALFIRPSSLLLDKLSEVIVPNKLFNFIFQGIAILGVISMISVESKIFALILRGRR